MIRKIISGGQTGVDRGALDGAISSNCAYGGWIPKGRRSEDGCVPLSYTHLTESTSKNYLKRTEHNVVDSDATIILCPDEPTGGTLRTIEFCKKHNRPFWVDDPYKPCETDRGMEVAHWIEAEFGMKPIVLNVAGPRESKCPGIQEFTKRYIERMLEWEDHLDINDLTSVP